MTTSLSQNYINACNKRSLKPNSSLVSYLAQYNACPDHLTELDLSLTSYVGPQGFIPVVEAVVLSPRTSNLKVLNASDNRITNESLEVLLEALLEKFANTNNIFCPPLASSLTNNAFFEFSLDLSKNPITFVGGKKILSFLAQLQKNNETKTNRIPISMEINVDNTLVTPTGIVSIDEQCQKQRLEVKFGEKIGDPRKEWEEIEKKDQEHKKMIQEKEKEESVAREERRRQLEKEQEEQKDTQDEDKIENVEEEQKSAGGFSATTASNNNKNDSDAATLLVSRQETKEGDDVFNNDENEKEEDGGESKDKTKLNDGENDQVHKKETLLFSGKNVKNIFVYHIPSKSWRSAKEDQIDSLSTKTHDCFVKPFSQTFAQNHPTKEEIPPQFSPHFPAMHLSSFKKELHSVLLNDSENVKQYWIQKTKDDDGEEGENEGSANTSIFLTEQQKKTMWVGATVSGSNSASATGGAPNMKIPVPAQFAYAKKTTKKKRYISDSDTSDISSEDSDDDDPPRKKKKIAVKKRMMRRLS